MKQKFEQLKLLFKNVRNARQEKENAELAITIEGSLPLDEKGPYSCLTTVALVEGREPLYVSFRCQSFKRGQCCKNAQCPAFEKNEQYVMAYNKYKTARQVRREFIKGLFIRTK